MLLNDNKIDIIIGFSSNKESEQIHELPMLKYPKWPIF